MASSNEAQVRSVEVLETFRAKLIIFLTKARRSLDSVGEEVKRTQFWIQDTQAPAWRQELKKRMKKLEQANAELMTARLSAFVDAPVAQQQALRRAKAAVEQSEEKLRQVKKWEQNFERLSDPMTKRLQTMRYAIDEEIPAAIAFLTNTIKILDDYAHGSPMSTPIVVNAPKTNEDGS